MTKDSTAAEKKCSKCIRLANKNGLAKMYCPACLEKANQRSMPTDGNGMTKEEVKLFNDFLEKFCVVIRSDKGLRKETSWQLPDSAIDVWKWAKQQREEGQKELVEKLRTYIPPSIIDGILEGLDDNPNKDER